MSIPFLSLVCVFTAWSLAAFPVCNGQSVIVPLSGFELVVDLRGFHVNPLSLGVLSPTYRNVFTVSRGKERDREKVSRPLEGAP